MASNTFGDKWSFTSFGESHGVAIGGVLDGVPAGITIDMELIRQELDRRAGRERVRGKSKVESRKSKVESQKSKVGVSARAINETDEVEWLSGVMYKSKVESQKSKVESQKSKVESQKSKVESQKSKVESQKSKELISLGTPIAFIIRNKDARPEDYEWLMHTYRTGHADKVYEQKYGIRDWRGGGRASARETAGRVVAGCIAKQQLAAKGVCIHARLIQVGAETDPSRFDEVIAAYRREGDSIGGIVECAITGLPSGTGEPIFGKLQAELAYAIMSINACKGFEYGTGFGGVTAPGSAINAISGGIAGGISDGTPVIFRCVFKPTPTTPKALAEVTKGQNTKCQGRHDACVATRAVPVVEAMTALALVNLIP